MIPIHPIMTDTEVVKALGMEEMPPAQIYPHITRWAGKVQGYEVSVENDPGFDGDGWRFIVEPFTDEAKAYLLLRPGSFGSGKRAEFECAKGDLAAALMNVLYPMESGDE